MARKDVQRGQFIVADGGRAEISDRRDRIRAGMYLTSMPVTRSNKNLQAEFPQFADSIAAAGPPMSTKQIADFWAEQLALEQRLAALKARIKQAKRR